MEDLVYLQSQVAVEFPLLSDVDLEVIGAYGVLDPGNEIAWPAIFIIGSDGTVKWRSISETYKERAPSAVLVEALE